ncbi:MAG: hypothetical protein ACE5G0_10415 [Rhodothermales bacterium]
MMKKTGRALRILVRMRKKTGLVVLRNERKVCTNEGSHRSDFHFTRSTYRTLGNEKPGSKKKGISSPLTRPETGFLLLRFAAADYPST